MLDFDGANRAAEQAGCLRQHRRDRISMKQRNLGSQGLTTSAEGLGCMGMTAMYGMPDDEESIATIHRAIELGVTLFDTSDFYGPFTGEELLGRALKGRRDQVSVATKFGGAEFDDTGNIVGGPNGRPENVRKSIEGSLRRLDTDHIDMYYQHRVDPGVPPEETFGALGDLVAEGKVRYLGISEAGPDTIRRAHSAAPLSALQTEYSLFTRHVETNGALATIRELGIGFVGYSPLGRGFLTGRVRSVDGLPQGDFRRTSPRFQGENLATNLALLDRIESLAAERGITPGQLALAWVLAQGDDIVPIPGTKRRTYLEQNVAAADLVLDQATLDALEEAVPMGSIAGDRYAQSTKLDGDLRHGPS
jgi:aryl-alcohol dehydrogenase-like predicted oxidoreductase